MTRIAIAGHPLSGKSTLALLLADQPIRLTDDEISLVENWDQIVSRVTLWFDEPGPWTICGVVVPHALQRWRQWHPGSPPPLEHYVFIRRPTFEGLTKGQTILAKGIDTVHSNIVRWLLPVLIDERELRQKYVPPTKKRS